MFTRELTLIFISTIPLNLSHNAFPIPLRNRPLNPFTPSSQQPFSRNPQPLHTSLQLITQLQRLGSSALSPHPTTINNVV